MARKMAKLMRNAYGRATERNYEGFPTFTLPLEEQALQVLTTGVWEHTGLPPFYVPKCLLAPAFSACSACHRAANSRGV